MENKDGPPQRGRPVPHPYLSQLVLHPASRAPFCHGRTLPLPHFGQRSRRGADGAGTARPDPSVFHKTGIHHSGSAGTGTTDRKSTRLNSSHVAISYAVFCLKKKKKTTKTEHSQLT